MSDDEWLAPRPEPGSRAKLAVQGSDASRQEVAAPKLLIRPKAAGDSSTSEKTEKPAPKSLKQKEAEYAAARARIFGYSASGNGYGSGRSGGRSAPGRGPAGGSGRGQGRGHGNPGGRSARAGDADDPDYDRNPSRYAPRLSSDEEPMPKDGRYQLPTYENEF
eukprot:CAMPEP_0197630886 /NCGR_PEP_ID=MMETSP1338-20131121/8235_1 /TAXON_ID=43686 ORGANISM="Pelagodinium beii, Strain RCC1491" /NCGR_SAMPLE_ID=MMETSP1338 /ASSEMBLY_ACC=CAM_ASM_000754 /LENGTH=162 /DNA_ID=CAMNT_0043202221 /DNA_START=62 /DNA_END=547 /DNA_ORIENTATION=+